LEDALDDRQVIAYKAYLVPLERLRSIVHAIFLDGEPGWRVRETTVERDIEAPRSKEAREKKSIE
jgi:hypothetical protein